MLKNRSCFPYFLFVAFFFISASCFADKATLPRCVNTPTALKNIQDILQINKSNDRKYNGYKVELQNESDETLAGRLVYAEVLAANCREHQETLIDKIAAVVANRVLARKGDVKSVIFQRDQFASSLNMYKNSRHQDFLCPQDVKLWTDVLKKISSFLKEKKTTLPADVMNYFLYKHDPRWSKEPWTLKEETQNSNESIRSCLKVFHVPGWK
jgi:hypothetical protein